MFKSKAQIAKLTELVKQGKMSQAKFDEWHKATDHSKLPERVHPKDHKEAKADYPHFDEIEKVLKR